MPVAIWATRKKRTSRTREIVLQLLRIVAIALLLALLLDLIIILLVLFFPFQILNLPSQFLKLLDVGLIVSLAVVEVPLGVGIGAFLWRFLGERRLSIIEQANAMIKYDHLMIIERKRTRYVINTKTKTGYLLSPIIKKLVGEGIIQFSETELDGLVFEEKEPTFKELDLVS